MYKSHDHGSTHSGGKAMIMILHASRVEACKAMIILFHYREHHTQSRHIMLTPLHAAIMCSWHVFKLQAFYTIHLSVKSLSSMSCIKKTYLWAHVILAASFTMPWYMFRRVWGMQCMLFHTRLQNWIPSWCILPWTSHALLGGLRNGWYLGTGDPWALITQWYLRYRFSNELAGLQSFG